MTRTFLLVALASGCAPGNGDEALVGCLDDSTTPIDDGTAVPDGFADSPDAYEGRITTGDALLTLVDDTELAMAIALDGLDLDTLVQRSWRSDGSGAEIALDEAESCGPVLRATGVVASLDAGERLAEEATVVVQVDESGIATFAASIPLDDLVGSASPLGLDPADYDSVTLLVAAAHDGTAWSGRLDFQAERVDDTGPDGTASATNDPYGTFGPAEDAE